MTLHQTKADKEASKEHMTFLTLNQGHEYFFLLPNGQVVNIDLISSKWAVTHDLGNGNQVETAITREIVEEEEAE